ncbi:MAG: nucleoside monophosphate kinase [Candidatus Doudnabacteria bacterium]
MKQIIILMGPPGSGKGTQSRLLMEKLGYGYFSMGDTFREAAKQDNDLGRLIKTTIDQGMIVSDELTKQVFDQEIEKVMGKPGLILDGFPRTAGQVEMLNSVLAKHNISDQRIFVLDVDKVKLLTRLSLRSATEGRVDDSDIARVEKRFEEYEKKTAQIRDYYESKEMLIHINGDQSIEGVQQEILSQLGIL